MKDVRKNDYLLTGVKKHGDGEADVWGLMTAEPLWNISQDARLAVHGIMANWTILKGH